MRVDAVSKVAQLEVAEKEKMKAKVDKIIKHGCNVFINRYTYFHVTYCYITCWWEECHYEAETVYLSL